MEPQESSWARPVRCGWCGGVVGAGAPGCHHCGMDFRRPFLKPLKSLMDGLLLFSVLAGALALLLPLSPLVVVLPMAVDYLVLRRRADEDDAAAPRRLLKRVERKGQGRRLRRGCTGAAGR